METQFRDKTGKVIVVDGSAPVRQLLSESVKSMGFKDVQGVASIQETLAILEVEKVTWILCPLAIDQEIHNAFGLLRLCNSQPTLREIRVTLLVEDHEMEFIPTAFEQGLLSFIEKPFNKESLLESIHKLQSTLENNAFNATLTSACYLRDVIAKEKNPEQLIEFEKTLLDLNPGNPELIANLLQPLADLNRFEEARNLINQLKLFQSSGPIEEIVAKVEKLLPPATAENPPTVSNLLNIKSCVIVDPDSAVAATIQDLLKEVGAENITVFSDGEAAWEHIKSNEEPSVIIQEWQIPKVSGPVLLQRIVNHGFLSVPILTVTNLIKPQDIPLMKEMGVANVILKPLEKKNFLSTLATTIKQDRAPSETRFLERKIRLLLRKGDRENAQILSTKYISTSNVPLGNKKLIEAEMAFANSNYTAAKDLSIEALQLCGDSIIILNLLGKVFMKLNDFTSSLKCFEKAQNLSPMNISRLCEIAEASSESGDDAKFSENIEHAKQLDSGSPAIAEAEAKIAINHGNSSLAKKLMKNMESLDNVISYMNNKAVVLARSGRIDESTALYSKAFEAIPDERTEILGIVSYNTALAHIRGDDLSKSLDLLKKAIELGSAKMKAKADSLTKKVEFAIKRGDKLKLAETQSETKMKTELSRSAADKRDLVISSIDANRGEICCHLIYFAKERSDRVNKLLGKMPHFTPRKAIARDAALGVEKMLHASGS